MGSATNSDPFKAATAECPAGKVAVGGGGILAGTGIIGLPPSEVALVTTVPVAVPSSGPVNAWLASGHEVAATASNWGITAYVLCATP